MSATTPQTAATGRDDRMPAGIPYIISNEFAERFCFYGINSILTIYLVQFMHFTDAKSASWQSLFKSGGLLLPDDRRDRLRRLLGQVQDDHDVFSMVVLRGLRLARAVLRHARRGRAGTVHGGVRHRRDQAVRLDERRRPVHLQEPAPDRAGVLLVLSGDQRRVDDLDLVLPGAPGHLRPGAGVRDAGRDDVRRDRGVLARPQEVRRRPSRREGLAQGRLLRRRRQAHPEPDRHLLLRRLLLDALGPVQRQHVDPSGSVVPDEQEPRLRVHDCFPPSSRSSTACSSWRSFRCSPT